MTQAVAAFRLITCSALCILAFSASASAAEPVSLMGMISEWQYPGSNMKGAEMADGATVDDSGNRTVQSIACKATLTTDASVETVLDFYRSKLKPKPKGEAGAGREAGEGKGGRSVVFSDDSGGRPFAMHTIIVNTSQSATMLVITRADGEAETYISWKHYKRL